MDILEELKKRRSVRAYTDKAVSKADLEKIAEAGLFAASGMGRQVTTIVCVTDKKLRDELSRLNARVLGKDADPFYGAPYVFAVLSDDIPTSVEDGSLVLGNMMNEASSIGLSTCWIHRGKEVFESDEGKAIKKQLNIPETYRGIGFLIVGYAEKIPEAAARKEGRLIFV